MNKREFIKECNSFKRIANNKILTYANYKRLAKEWYTHINLDMYLEDCEITTLSSRLNFDELSIILEYGSIKITHSNFYTGREYEQYFDFYFKNGKYVLK